MQSIDRKLAFLVAVVFVATAAGSVWAQSQPTPPGTNVGTGAVSTQVPNQTGDAAAKAGEAMKDKATEQKK